MLGLPFFSLNSLLSLPVISYFLLPTTTTGWSTYLNLIFFSLAWTSLVWTQPPLAVEFFSILGVRLAFFVAPSLFFLAFDLLVPTAARGFKARDDALPYEAAGSASGVKTQKERVARIVGLSLLNLLVSIGLQTGIDFILTDLLHLRATIKISSRLPAPWTLLTDVMKGLLMRGTLSYYIHRFALHNDTRSASLTKVHSSYAHSLDNALPCVAAYDHPLPYLLHRWVPVFLPAAFFRFHIFTYMAFLTLVSLEEAFVFSGYQVLPSTILLTGMARRQERHIMSGGKGNFSPYGILDFVHGTTLDEGDVMDDLRKEAGKRNVKGKARGAASTAREAVDRFDNRRGDDDDDGDTVAGENEGRRGKKSRK